MLKPIHERKFSITIFSFLLVCRDGCFEAASSHWFSSAKDLENGFLHEGLWPCVMGVGNWANKMCPVGSD